ncbi:MAG: helix-turn-helix domain-containing protein [Chitinophagaceae bacterium]
MINITRLKKIAELLVEGRYKIYVVADLAGNAAQTNFSRNFLKQFNMPPSDYLSMKEAEKNK